MKSNKTYTELMTIPTFEERFEYLKLNGVVGEPTFGSMRYLNQVFYTSKEWRRFKNSIVIRDNGCDLAIKDRIIFDQIVIHHIDPITVEDLLNPNSSNRLLNADNVICVSSNTHKAIHYGDSSLLYSMIRERKPGDTKLW